MGSLGALWGLCSFRLIRGSASSLAYPSSSQGPQMSDPKTWFMSPGGGPWYDSISKTTGASGAVDSSFRQAMPSPALKHKSILHTLSPLLRMVVRQMQHIPRPYPPNLCCWRLRTPYEPEMCLFALLLELHLRANSPGALYQFSPQHINQVGVTRLAHSSNVGRAPSYRCVSSLMAEFSEVILSTTW